LSVTDLGEMASTMLQQFTQDIMTKVWTSVFTDSSSSDHQTCQIGKDRRNMLRRCWNNVRPSWSQTRSHTAHEHVLISWQCQNQFNQSAVASSCSNHSE